MNLRVVILISLLGWMAFFLGAQENPVAGEPQDNGSVEEPLLTEPIQDVPGIFEQALMLSYADGKSFEVVSNGEGISYRIPMDDLANVAIQVDDTILTDAESRVELLIPGGGVVIVTEGSSLTVKELDGSGGGVLDLGYGRVRAVVPLLYGDSRLWITGYDTVAGVQGGDFGYDLFADPESSGVERISSVYSFDGDVEVLRYDPRTDTKVTLLERIPHLISDDLMARVRSVEGPVRLRSEKIAQEILDYWNAHPLLTPDEVLLAAGMTSTADELNMLAGRLPNKKALRISGQVSFGVGVGMLTAAGLLKLLVKDNKTADQGALSLAIIGSASVVTGGALMGYAFTLPF
ncbi:MAG: hypothetical protein MI717_15575 [Spirochaetales bacterium]|nr:hypothetical protein [Spirochaetales bacterium]